MSDPISALSSYLGADLEQLRAVAQNVANSATPGYRALRAVPRFDAAGPATGGPGATLLATGDGALRATGRALDLAVTGDAFLLIATPDGDRLTRNGQLRLAADGTLVDGDGHAVLGVDGPLVLGAGAFAVAGDGTVSQGGRAIGRLRLVTVADPRTLRALGASHYAADTPLLDGRGTVRQGMLEGANVDVGAEMVRLMELARHAESVQRAVATYDQMLNTGVNRLGE